jgi:hypothetical protein
MAANPTKIVNCDCKHAHQDAHFGAQRRSANLTTKGKQEPVYRCTVCGKLH